MELNEIQEYIEVVQPLGWVGVALVSLWFFNSPLKKILIGLAKKINGTVDENVENKVLDMEQALYNDFRHEFDDFKKEVRKDLKELNERTIKNEANVANLVKQVNGKYRS